MAPAGRGGGARAGDDRLAGSGGVAGAGNRVCHVDLGVERAAVECGFDFSGIIRPENEKAQYQLSYAEFVVPLVKAVQELSRQNEALKNELEALKAAIQTN